MYIYIHAHTYTHIYTNVYRCEVRGSLRPTIRRDVEGVQVWAQGGGEVRRRANGSLWLKQEAQDLNSQLSRSISEALSSEGLCRIYIVSRCWSSCGTSF